MKPNYIRLILVLLILFPAGILVYAALSDKSGSVNPSSNIEAAVFLSGIAILGLLQKKQWVFYYVYVGLGIVALSFIFGGVEFLAYNGLWALIFVLLYFGIIFYLTNTLHRDNIKAHSASMEKN